MTDRVQVEPEGSIHWAPIALELLEQFTLDSDIQGNHAGQTSDGNLD